MHLIGYWVQSLLDVKYFPPQELVGELPAETRELVATYLDRGSVFESYRGISWCRFGCKHASMGSRELTDGQWVWPEGLSHYIRDHGVTLPNQFLRHVLGGGSHAPADSPEQIPSDQLWCEWCNATSSRHMQPALAKARALAPARAQELREASWRHREAKGGLSKAPCVQQGCTNMALAGMALCAMHASSLDGFDPGSMAYFEGLVEVLNA